MKSILTLVRLMGEEIGDLNNRLRDIERRLNTVADSDQLGNLEKDLAAIRENMRSGQDPYGKMLTDFENLVKETQRLKKRLEAEENMEEAKLREVTSLIGKLNDKMAGLEEKEERLKRMLRANQEGDMARDRSIEEIRAELKAREERILSGMKSEIGQMQRDEGKAFDALKSELAHVKGEMIPGKVGELRNEMRLAFERASGKLSDIERQVAIEGNEMKNLGNDLDSLKSGVEKIGAEINSDRTRYGSLYGTLTRELDNLKGITESVSKNLDNQKEIEAKDIGSLRDSYARINNMIEDIRIKEAEANARILDQIKMVQMESAARMEGIRNAEETDIKTLRTSVSDIKENSQRLYENIQNKFSALGTEQVTLKERHSELGKEIQAIINGMKMMDQKLSTQEKVEEADISNVKDTMGVLDGKIREVEREERVMADSLLQKFSAGQEMLTERMNAVAGDEEKAREEMRGMVGNIQSNVSFLQNNFGFLENNVKSQYNRLFGKINAIADESKAIGEKLDETGKMEKADVERLARDMNSLDRLLKTVTTSYLPGIREDIKSHASDIDSIWGELDEEKFDSENIIKHLDSLQSSLEGLEVSDSRKMKEIQAIGKRITVLKKDLQESEKQDVKQVRKDLKSITSDIMKKMEEMDTEMEAEISATQLEFQSEFERLEKEQMALRSELTERMEMNHVELKQLFDELSVELKKEETDTQALKKLLNSMQIRVAMITHDLKESKQRSKKQHKSLARQLISVAEFASELENRLKTDETINEADIYELNDKVRELTDEMVEVEKEEEKIIKDLGERIHSTEQKLSKNIDRLDTEVQAEKINIDRAQAALDDVSSAVKEIRKNMQDKYSAVETELDVLEAKSKDISDKLRKQSKIEVEDVNELRSALSNVNSKIKDVESGQVKLEKTVLDRIKESNDIVESKFINLEKSMEEDKASLLNIKNTISEVDEAIGGMQQEISGARGEYGALKGELESIRGMANELSEKIVRGEQVESQNISQLRGKLTSLSTRIKDMQEEESKERQSLKDTIDSVKSLSANRFSMIESRIEESNRNMQNIREIADSLNRDMGNIQEQIKGETDEFKGQVSDKISAVQGNIKELSERMAKGKGIEEEEIAQLRLAFESIARDVEDKAKIKDISDLRINIKKLNDEMTDSMSNQQKNINSAKELINLLKDDMGKIQSQISGKKDEYSDLVEKVDNINSQITDLGRKLDDGKNVEAGEIVKLRGDVNTLESQMDERAKTKEITDGLINETVDRFTKKDDIDAISADLKKGGYTPGQIKQVLEDARMKWVYA